MDNRSNSRANTCDWSPDCELTFSERMYLLDSKPDRPAPAPPLGVFPVGRVVGRDSKVIHDN